MWHKERLPGFNFRVKYINHGTLSPRARNERVGKAHLRHARLLSLRMRREGDSARARARSVPLMPPRPTRLGTEE